LKRITEQEREVIYTFKIVIVGGPSVGKTCLFNRFCFNSFNFDTSLTIGLNFHSIDLKINKKEDFEELTEKYIVNSIFDFGGQDRFKPLIPKFLGGADGALLVFDLTNMSSFNQLDFWYNKLLQHADGMNIPKILVGSKRDLIEKALKEDLVNEELIYEYIENRSLDHYFRTSALRNYNVLEVFKELNNLMLKNNNTPYIVV